MSTEDDNEMSTKLTDTMAKALKALSEVLKEHGLVFDGAGTIEIDQESRFADEPHLESRGYSSVGFGSYIDHEIIAEKLEGVTDS